jgi:flagellar biosynthesis/type III secretory pathway protein FliH
MQAPICTKRHQSQRTQNAMVQVAESQRSFWRHKCAACAYEEGFDEGVKQGLAQALAAIQALQ